MARPKSNPQVVLRPHDLVVLLRLFIEHGARYCFPATRGSLTRGLPTGFVAAPLKASIQPGTDPVPVWPYKNGPVRGGSARERALALGLLNKRLQP